MEFASSVSTPFGTFSGSLRPDSVDRKSSYFLVRYEGNEQVYCVASKGKLELTTEGSNTIVLSQLEGFSNVTVVECISIRGAVQFNFIPDSTTSDLATLNLYPKTWILKRNGKFAVSLFLRNVEYDISAIVFCDLPEQDRLVMSVKLAAGGLRRSFDCQGQRRLEALWFLACIEQSNPNLSRKIHPLEHFENCTICNDGSLILPKNNPRDGRVFRSQEYGNERWLFPSEFIKSVSLRERPASSYIQVLDVEVSDFPFPKYSFKFYGKTQSGVKETWTSNFASRETLVQFIAKAEELGTKSSPR